jgi:Flp pilus assembly CpaF family ATPase
MNHPLVLSTFITQLDECLEDISKVYSSDSRFVRCKLYLDTLKKTNPRMIITTWKTQVADKYEEHILAGNIDYFLNKDYTQELPVYNPTIDQAIQDLRKAIQSMSEENKNKSIQYIQNLCKLSKLYVS